MFDVMVVFYKIGKERLSKAFDPISLFPEITNSITITEEFVRNENPQNLPYRIINLGIGESNLGFHKYSR